MGVERCLDRITASSEAAWEDRSRHHRALWLASRAAWPPSGSRTTTGTDCPAAGRRTGPRLAANGTGPSKLDVRPGSPRPRCSSSRCRGGTRRPEACASASV